MALTDPAQNVTDRWTYDAFGGIIQQQGNTPNLYNFIGALGVEGHVGHGLLYMRHRYYDPMVGRFITEDPLRDGLNWYAYCGNNPVNGVDPWGLQPEEVKPPPPLMVPGRPLWPVLLPIPCPGIPVGWPMRNPIIVNPINPIGPPVGPGEPTRPVIIWPPNLPMPRNIPALPPVIPIPPAIYLVIPLPIIPGVDPIVPMVPDIPDPGNPDDWAEWGKQFEKEFLFPELEAVLERQLEMRLGVDVELHLPEDPEELRNL